MYVAVHAMNRCSLFRSDTLEKEGDAVGKDEEEGEEEEKGKDEEHEDER